jgi:hypothetical protein
VTEVILASGRAAQGVPGTVALGGHPHEWYSPTEGPVVDLGALPRSEAVAAVVDRLLRMRRGEKVELRSGADLDPVWREISTLSPGGYRFTVLQGRGGRVADAGHLPAGGQLTREPQAARTIRQA